MSFYQLLNIRDIKIVILTEILESRKSLFNFLRVTHGWTHREDIIDYNNANNIALWYW